MSSAESTGETMLYAAPTSQWVGWEASGLGRDHDAVGQSAQVGPGPCCTLTAYGQIVCSPPRRMMPTGCLEAGTQLRSWQRSAVAASTGQSADKPINLPGRHQLQQREAMCGHGHAEFPHTPCRTLPARQP